MGVSFQNQLDKVKDAELSLGRLRSIDPAPRGFVRLRRVSQIADDPIAQIDDPEVVPRRVRGETQSFAGDIFKPSDEVSNKVVASEDPWLQALLRRPITIILH